MSIFETLLASVEPQPVREMLLCKFNEVVTLVSENDKSVALVNEAKETNPDSPDYQDAVWRRVVKANEDAEMVASEKRLQKAEEQMAKELKFLRDASRKHMGEALSEEKVRELKKSINEGKSVIADAMAGAKAFAEMADTMLALAGRPVEGGIFAKLPQPESLLNSRPRKSTATANSGGSVGVYATRVNDITVDGKSTNKMVPSKADKNVKENKGHFNYAAETLSRMWDSNQHKENLITATELEEAYYADKSVEFRDAASMPEVHEFKFTRDIVVQNPNDDSTKKEPHTVLIKVTRNIRTGNPKTETPAETPKTDAAETK